MATGTRWQTFAQTGKPVSPFRQKLLDQARTLVAKSDNGLPVKRYTAVHFEGGEHPCGVNLDHQAFYARTREGALVIVLDWMNENWPTSGDNYPDADQDVEEYVADMFSPHATDEHLVFLVEGPGKHNEQKHRASDT